MVLSLFLFGKTYCKEVRIKAGGLCKLAGFSDNCFSIPMLVEEKFSDLLAPKFFSVGVGRTRVQYRSHGSKHYRVVGYSQTTMINYQVPSNTNKVSVHVV